MRRTQDSISIAKLWRAKENNKFFYVESMGKAKAIRLKCLDCSGDSPKEVTLCHLVSCPLWPYRFGYSTNDKRYQKRMETAKRNYPDEYLEVMKMIADQSHNGQNSLGNT